MNRWIALGVVGFCAGGCVAGGPTDLAPVHELFASDGADDDSFGWSVNTDGVLAIVGAPQRFNGGNGAAYVFDLATGAQIQKLVAPDGSEGDAFGSAVALDGDIAVIGASSDDDSGNRSGSAYIMRISDGSLIAKINGSDTNSSDDFGESVAIEGDRVVVGAGGFSFSLGAAYLFETSTGTELTRLIPTGSARGFGESVAIANGRIVVGNRNDGDTSARQGSAHVFRATDGAHLFEIEASDGTEADTFGAAVAISDEHIACGAPTDSDTVTNGGSAYSFDASTGIQLAKTTPVTGASEQLGLSVAVTDTFIICGAPLGQGFGAQRGKAFAFAIDDGSTTYRLVPSPSQLSGVGQFGFSAHASGHTVIVGAFTDSSPVATGTGSAFVFTIPEPTCPADLAEPTGVLNFFDLGEFLTRFNAQDPSVDFAEPFGTFNFFDLGEYLTLFNQGCP